MHTLQNHFSALALNVQDAFVTQKLRTVAIDHGVHKLSKADAVKWTIRLEHKTLHVVVMMLTVLGGARCLLRGQAEFARQVESSHIENVGKFDLTKWSKALCRAGVHEPEAITKHIDIGRRNEIGLADEDAIGKADLAAGFAAGVELLHAVFGIDEGQDGVGAIAGSDLLIEKES